MARIFITGSTDGLGQLAAKDLLSKGHNVVVHARNKQRADDIQETVPGAESIVIGDLSDLEETKALADKVNAMGHFDAIIHNAGILRASGREILTVNTLAPYVLTCLLHKPRRLVYLGSGMHKHGRPALEKIGTGGNQISYSDSKLQVLLLAKAVARKWPDVCANVVDPGWVPTKMGGPGAPGDLQKGYETQVWLAASNDENAIVSGRYFHHKQPAKYHPDADKTDLQDALLERCEEVTGVRFPADPV